MASSGKKKTTMGKLNRERKLRERRIDKQARKEARKLAPADYLGPTGEELNGELGEPVEPETDDPSLEPLSAPRAGGSD